MTFYLKYRPQKISDLDLTQVREALTRILSTKDIPHAFLFSGPRGAGKTSAARIVAKVLNCEVRGGKVDNEVGSGIEPCGKCSQCVAITNGSSLDVIEIDAASNRGVDDIRSLREGVKLSPASASKKVYIIDEAHMLTAEASNALLKTLEEPPAHVVFILATTNPGKLLDTIRSRTTNVVFPKATEDEVLGSLDKAVKGEKLKVEKGVLSQIAKSVDGSFREAHKVLEQVSIGREKVTLEDLEGVQGISVDKLLNLLKSKDAAGALEEVDSQISSGTDPKQYAVGMVSALRQILLAELGVGESQVPAGTWDLEKVKEAIELFSKATIEVSTSPIAQLPLELAVVGMIGSAENKKSKIKNQKVLDPDKSDASSSKENDPPKVEAPAPALEEKLEVRSEKEKKESHITHQNPASHVTPPTSYPDLEHKWKIVMQTVRPQNHSIEALLRATRPTSFDGRILTIEVFYKFHKERIEKDPYRKLVEEMAEVAFGAPVTLSCQLSSEKQKAVDFVNVTENVEDDIVRAAEDIFGAQAADPGDLPN